MEALLYFAFWAALIFLMMRFGCGAHVMGHGHGHDRKSEDGGAAPTASQELRWTPPRKDTDPVCGKTVSTDAAKPSVFDGYVHYFCSRECREVFEAAPDLYVPGKESPTRQQLEHSHG